MIYLAPKIGGQANVAKNVDLAPDGKRVARFQSTWRRTAAGPWEIVFDFGEDACR